MDDVTIEILLRLPVQSLLRFKSVCKSWYNIIDSSAFKKSHLHRRHNNRGDDDDDDTMFLIYTKRNVETFIRHYCALEVKEKWHELRAFKQRLIKGGNLCVVGPDNGLICIFDPSLPPTTTDISIAVYNPCLDQIYILPPSTLDNHRYYFNRLVGIGSSDNNNDYKVLQLLPRGQKHTLVEVYSRTTDTWTKVPLNGDDEFITPYHTIKTIMPSKNGSWANWQIQSPCGQYHILSFDMKNEVFETISYPNLEGRNVYLRSMEVFVKDDDSFILFVYTFDYAKLELWELQSPRAEGRSWSHVTDIIPSLFHPNPEIKRNFKCISALAKPSFFLPEIGNFEFIQWPKALWKHGVIFNAYLCDDGEHNFIFYDYSIHKVVGIKTCKLFNSPIEICEIKGSLISP